MRWIELDLQGLNELGLMKPVAFDKSSVHEPVCPKSIHSKTVVTEMCLPRIGLDLSKVCLMSVLIELSLKLWPLWLICL